MAKTNLTNTAPSFCPDAVPTPSGWKDPKTGELLVSMRLDMSKFSKPAPTAAPTVAPTAAPTVAPTAAPTVAPVEGPAVEEVNEQSKPKARAPKAKTPE